MKFVAIKVKATEQYFPKYFFPEKTYYVAATFIDLLVN